MMWSCVMIHDYLRRVVPTGWAQVGDLWVAVNITLWQHLELVTTTSVIVVWIINGFNALWGSWKALHKSNHLSIKTPQWLVFTKCSTLAFLFPESIGSLLPPAGWNVSNFRQSISFVSSPTNRLGRRWYSERHWWERPRLMQSRGWPRPRKCFMFPPALIAPFSLSAD